MTSTNAHGRRRLLTHPQRCDDLTNAHEATLQDLQQLRLCLVPSQNTISTAPAGTPSTTRPGVCRAVQARPPGHLSAQQRIESIRVRY